MAETFDPRLEDKRQLEHFVPIAFAFLLPYISLGTALALCGLALLHALVFSPRLVRATTRPAERKAGWSRGKVYYALSVALLLLFFHDAIYLAAAVWAILSTGDSVSNLVGRRLPHPRLPFNREKSWAGLLSFWLSSAAAAWILLRWNLPPGDALPLLDAALICILTALACAIAESLATGIDDNLLIPWTGCFAILVVSQAVPFHWTPALSGWQAAGLNAAIGLPALLLGWLSPLGATIAFGIGMAVSSGFGTGGFAVLTLFLVLGSLATRLGRRAKRRRGLEEPKGGRRGIANVLANGAVAAFLGLAAALHQAEWLCVAFVCALGTAAFDTVATEIGQWLGRTTIDPRSFRAVPPGTPGAVSLEGTLSGAGAAALISTAAWGTGLMAGVLVPWTCLAASIAAFSESYLGSALADDRPETGHGLNFVNTLLGASLGGLLTWWIV